MIVNEDGSVTGSINAAQLDDVEPKSDEARAQLEQLKAERDAAAEQADADAARLAEVHAAQSVEGQADRDTVTTEGTPWGDPNVAAQQQAGKTGAADQSAQSAPADSSSGSGEKTTTSSRKSSASTSSSSGKE
jgi:regulator of protease activity HflC (stomatin/prohibitin superfamily)